MWRYKDLSKYMINTRDWVRNVRESLSADPDYIKTFSGYNL